MAETTSDNDLFTHLGYQALIGVDGELNSLEDSGSDIYLALMADTYSPDRYSQDTWDDISSDEIDPSSNDGYSAGGESIDNRSLTEDDASTPRVLFEGDDVTWTSSSITARYGVYYDNTPSDDTNKTLIGVLDFGETMESDDGDFSVEWDSEGIFEATFPTSS